MTDHMTEGGMRDLVNGIDPRIKLLILILVGNATFFAPGSVGLIWCFLVVLVLVLMAGEYRLSVMSSVLFLVVMGLDALSVRYLGNDMIGLSIGMFTFMLARLTPLFMIVLWALDTTGSERVIAAMQNMRIPKGFTVAIAVMFRFVPTTRYEFGYIKNTMKLRGIGLRWQRVLTHPLATLEYALVPLLMRSMKIGDDLSASALTRGLGRPIRRSSLQDVRIRAFDGVFFLAFVGLVSAGFLAIGG